MGFKLSLQSHYSETQTTVVVKVESHGLAYHPLPKSLSSISSLLFQHPNIENLTALPLAPQR